MDLEPDLNPLRRVEQKDRVLQSESKSPWFKFRRYVGFAFGIQPNYQAPIDLWVELDIAW